MEAGDWRRQWTGVVALGLACAMVACTSSGDGASTRNGTGVPSESTTPTVRIVSRDLAPAPTNCPGPPPAARRVFKPLGPLFGTDPIWAGVYANFDDATNAFHLPGNASLRRDGWPIKVLWVMRDTATSTVTLSARDSSTGQPVLFEIAGTDPTTEPLYDPGNPPIPPQDGGLKEFPSDLFFPAAGCYTLTASSDDESWTIGFGFGE